MKLQSDFRIFNSSANLLRQLELTNMRDLDIRYIKKAFALFATILCMCGLERLPAQGNYPRVSYQFDYEVEFDDAFVLKSGNIIFSTSTGIIVKIDRNGQVMDTTYRGLNYEFPIEPLTDSTFIIAYNVNQCDISSYTIFCLMDTNLQLIWRTAAMNGNPENLFGNISRLSDTSFIISSDYGGMRLYYSDSTTNSEFDNSFWFPDSLVDRLGPSLPAGGDDFIHTHGNTITLYTYKPFGKAHWNKKTLIFTKRISGLEYHPGGGYGITSGSQLIFLTAGNDIRKNINLSAGFHKIVAMESDSHFFYLVGYDTISGISRLAKYDSAGNQIWISTFGNKAITPVAVMLHDTMVTVAGNEKRIPYYSHNAFVWNFSRGTGQTTLPISEATIDTVSIDSVFIDKWRNAKLRLSVDLRNSGADTLNSVYIFVYSQTDWCDAEGTRLRFDSLAIPPGSSAILKTNLMLFSYLLHQMSTWQTEILHVLVRAPNDDLDADVSDDLYLFTHGLVSRGEEFASELVKVWPNPTSGILELEIRNTVGHSCSATICDPLGRVICRSEEFSKETEIDLSAFQNGIYCCKITSRNSSETVPVILIK